MNSSLQNKNVLLGVCGGIAAYKSADLVRRLQDAGADVRVVMTQSATEFVTPLTFQALSGHTVHTSLLDTEAEKAMGHIELARWADLILIAPATANSIARLAGGRADDLLSAICLASQALKALAPAMNHVMWSAETTQDNVQQLQKQGFHLFGPDDGSQACGETGSGRLLEPTELVSASSELFQTGELQGVHVMITAGPTFEPIDPVRYIGNRSSGRMGFALAQAAVEQGAIVTLVAGPVQLDTPSQVNRINVETALQMHETVMNNLTEQSIFIATAAVADYRPALSPTEKIKKSADDLNLTLIPNPDILAEVAAADKPPFTLGFAAETQNMEDFARQKLINKNLDMIAANQVSHTSEADEEDSGFNSEYNALHLFWQEHGQTVGEHKLERCRKTQLARQLITHLAKRYYEKTTT